MSKSLNAILIMGSTRDGRNCERVSKFVSKIAKELDFNVTVFDPLEMNVPMLKQPLHFMADQSKAPKWMLETNEKIKATDAFIIISPEYNCAVPPALSNFLDHFPPASYRHRPAAIITYTVGMMGGSRAGTLLRPHLSELGMVTVPAYVCANQITNSINPEGECSDDTLKGKMERILQELQWYGRAIKTARSETKPPT